MNKKIFLLGIVLSGFLLGDQIPKNAHQHLNTVYEEQRNIHPEILFKSYVPSLIEHESCISLKHSRCWSPRSELKTKREHGVGLGQITKAYDKRGKVRFDTLKGLVRRHPKELGELNWDNVKDRPDLQIRAILIMLKNIDDKLPMSIDTWNRLLMTDAAYNGGYGGLKRERKQCGLRKNCDPNIWFKNVENNCRKSRKAIYGKRSACDINRHHVKDVISKIPKYEIDRIENKR